LRFIPVPPGWLIDRIVDGMPVETAEVVGWADNALGDWVPCVLCDGRATPVTDFDNWRDDGYAMRWMTG
jgi:hypothetical protein